MLARCALNGDSSYSLAKEYNVSSGQIRYWAQIYSIHGPSGLISPLIDASASIKLSILNAMHENAWSLGYTSATFKLSSPGILYRWQQDFVQVFYIVGNKTLMLMGYLDCIPNQKVEK